ncbi:MAG: cold shock domain-containing protein [Microthrixaceae bacterium]
MADVDRARVDSRPPRSRLGTVSTFDDPRGVGTVETDDGVAVSFHCTSIADGSRTIEVGTRVAVSVRPGHRGCWEAARIEPVLPGSGRGRP